MSKFDSALSQTLRQWWQCLWIRYHFKFVLPRTNFAVINNIQLDISSFSPRVRNRILMGYEEPEKRMCQEFLRSTDSVLEFGAAIGFIGLYCQKNLGIKNYIMVEPNPQTIEILKHNYELNGFAPKVWNLAVAEADGSIAFDVAGDFWQHAIGATNEQRAGMIEVPCAPFESILAKAGPIDVVIIDIEGAERFIDFSKLPGGIKKVLIELHPEIIGIKSASQIVSALCSRGFRIACEEGNTFAFLKGD